MKSRDHAKLTAAPLRPHARDGHRAVMMRMLLFLGIACGGCVVLPMTKTTQRPVGTETSPPAYGKVKQVTLQTAASRSEVRVRALAVHECRRQVVAVTEITRSKRARLGVDDPRGRALGVLVAPVTLPISAIITGLIVASADDETSRVTTPIRVETDDCTKEASALAIELQFPSGQIYRGTTDPNGVVVLAIPMDEPYAGEVAVRAAGAQARVRYEQLVPPVTVARDAIDACRAQHPSAATAARLVIDHRGRVTRLAGGDDAFDACVGTRLVGVLFPPSLRNRTVVLPFAAPPS